MVLEALNILEGVNLAALGHNSTGYVHALTEALKLAAADREAYFGDPEFEDLPLNVLLSKPYAATCRALLNPIKAWPARLAGRCAVWHRRRGSRIPRRARARKSFRTSPRRRSYVSPTSTAMCSRQRPAMGRLADRVYWYWADGIDVGACAVIPGSITGVGWAQDGGRECRRTQRSRFATVRW